ncbi:MAG: hypothetical protein WBD28_00030 [Candidatus Zixiibacteriota bacterium]
MIKMKHLVMLSLFLILSCTSVGDWNKKANPIGPTDVGLGKRSWNTNSTISKFPENWNIIRELEISGAQSEDDGQESVGEGYVNTYYNYIELRVDLDRWGGAYRFPNVQIPQGSMINSAKISLVNYVSTFIHAVDSIACENVDSATVLAGEGYYDISNRWKRRTEAAVMWNQMINASPGVRDYTPDLKTLVQEIVNRPNWKSGNAIIFLFKCLSLESDTSHLELYSWDFDNHSYGGVLHLSYTVKNALGTEN